MKLLRRMSESVLDFAGSSRHRRSSASQSIVAVKGANGELAAGSESISEDDILQALQLTSAGEHKSTSNSSEQFIDEASDDGRRSYSASPTISRSSRRVSFSQHEIFAVVPAPEYDRTPSMPKLPSGSAERGAAYDELIEYCLSEMEVHPDMLETKVHSYLWGDEEDTKLHVRRKLIEANGGRRPSVKPKRRNTYSHR